MPQCINLVIPWRTFDDSSRLLKLKTVEMEWKMVDNLKHCKVVDIEVSEAADISFFLYSSMNDAVFLPFSCLNCDYNV